MKNRCLGKEHVLEEVCADLLLCAAKHWQNQEPRSICCIGPVTDDVFYHIPMGETLDNEASAALSEVASMGYSIADAVTNEDTEKVVRASKLRIVKGTTSK